METGLAAQPLNWAAHVRVGVCTFVCHLYSILLLADVPTHWGRYSPNRSRLKEIEERGGVGQQREGGVLRYAGTAVPPRCES